MVPTAAVWCHNRQQCTTAAPDRCAQPPQHYYGSKEPIEGKQCTLLRSGRPCNQLDQTQTLCALLHDWQSRLSKATIQAANNVGHLAAQCTHC